MKQIAMIGNTHFDPVWLWQWDEALSSITATFRAALERMKEDPNFVYSFSAPAVLEQVRLTDSELFEQIKERVLEGRWELAEGWWLQADCYGASGESYVRQGLYAQRYFQTYFSMKSKTAFNIDSFGHCEALPQILAKCGIENYAFCRPANDHYLLEQPLFIWEGDHGTSLKTYRVGGEGGACFGKPDMEEYCQKNKEQKHDLMMVFGVTDHGGAPTKAQIQEINRLSESYPISFSRVDDFFDRQDEEQLPRIKGEFLVNFIGPYSNVTEIKKNNRIAEYTLLNAEKICVIAQRLLGREYPAETIRQCWQDIMFNQFHDILGGACIKAAYFDARNLHGRALQTAGELLHYSLQAITNQMQMPGKNPDNAWNLVVWNCNPFRVEIPLEAEVQWAWEFDWYRDGIELEDEQGRIIPCQIIREQCVVPGFRSRFVFRAELEGLSCKSYIVRQTKSPVTVADPAVKVLENSHFQVTVNQEKCVLQKDGVLAAASLFKPYAVYDECDTWGFNKTVWDDKKQYMTLKSSKIIESGLVRTALKTVWEFQKSALELTYYLYEDAVECRYRVLWREERYGLKLELCGGDKGKSVTAASPYGFAQREECPWERPMGEWISLESEGGCMQVAADSVFSYNFQDGALGLTLLRNCIYGDLRTEPLDPEREYSYMGQGVTEGKILLYFLPRQEIANRATAFHNPPVVMAEANHQGHFPGTASFGECDSEQVQMTVIKQAENGEGQILRLYNTTDSFQKAKVRLFDTCQELEFAPKEIKTVLRKNSGFVECNMLEEDTVEK